MTSLRLASAYRTDLGRRARLGARALAPTDFRAYNVTEETNKQPTDLRAGLDTEHESWFAEAQTLTEKVEEEISFHRITGIFSKTNCNQANAITNTARDYYGIILYKVCVLSTLPNFLGRFFNDSLVVSNLLKMLPEFICSPSQSSPREVLCRLLDWKSDLCHRNKLEIELKN